MSDELVLDILEKYDLAPSELLPFEKGYRNESHPVELMDGQKINLIIFKSEPHILNKIKASNLVSDFLSDRNFPTRKLLDKRILEAKSGRLIKFCAVYNYLPGQTIPWDAYTMNHLKLLGTTFSDMHFELAKLKTSGELPHVKDIYKDLSAKMQKYFSIPEVSLAMKRKLRIKLDSKFLESVIKAVELAAKHPVSQVIHLDYVRGNLLFERPENTELHLSGILDFEKTAVGNTMFDIARTLAFLLVDCKYKTEEKIIKYFLSSGYNKYGKASFISQIVTIQGSRINLFEELINFYLIYDIYKFLLHNPYESLPQNEHYVRTLKLLMNRINLIKAI
jgi:Ser/Thr protein kinase RdoA (MazF antagonist)